MTRTSSSHRSTPDALALVVGARVRELRHEAGFSFDAFVEETGLGRGYISELERGLVMPSLASLARLASALEVTMADLVAGTTPRERLFVRLRGQPNHVIAAAERALANVGGHERTKTGSRKIARD